MKRHPTYFPTDTRGRLLEAIVNSQEESGNWCSVPGSDQSPHMSPWTTAEALICLSNNNCVPKDLPAAIDVLVGQARVHRRDVPVGWAHYRLENEGVGVPITSDCIIAMLLYGYREEALTAIEVLLELQHSASQFSGSWGFTEADDVGRTTPTCWAIRALTYAYHYTNNATLRSAMENSLSRAVQWLLQAQVIGDGEPDSAECGWGPTVGEESVSCTTALTTFVLLEAQDLKFLKGNRQAIRVAAACGIRKIRHSAHTYESEAGSFRHWEASTETYHDRQFRGQGTPLVLAAILKASEKGIITDPFVSEITDCLEYLTENEQDGWVKTFGRPSSVFDNSYWLSALMYFQEYCLKNSREVLTQISELEKRNAELEERNAELKQRPLEGPTAVKRLRRRSIKLLFASLGLLAVLFAFVDLHLVVHLNVGTGILATAVTGEAGVFLALWQILREK